MATTFSSWMQQVDKIGALGQAIELSRWDKMRNMPKGAADLRNKNDATLKGLQHELLTDIRFMHMSEDLLAGNLTEQQRSSIELIHGKSRRAFKIPADLSMAIQTATGKAGAKWSEARTENNFSILAPALRELVKLQREEGLATTRTGDPYDGLFEKFERGITSSRAVEIIEAHVSSMSGLLDRVAITKQPDSSILKLDYRLASVRRFLREKVIARMGIDTTRAIFTPTEHPFCFGINPDDVRICGYRNDRGFEMVTKAFIHEAGHGIGYQNLPKEWVNTPLASFGATVDEASARFWEVVVGQCPQFWNYWWRDLVQRFPFLHDRTPEEFARAMSRVRIQPIRVDADPITYGSHVLLRLRIEKALIGGDLEVTDVPSAWNLHLHNLLGVTAPDHLHGPLQDIHWALGYLGGYFATYSLGTMVAAHYAEAMGRAFGGIDGFWDLVESGDYQTIRQWLTKNVYIKGESSTAEELVQEVTGKSLSPEPFARIMTERMEWVYDLQPTKI